MAEILYKYKTVIFLLLSIILVAALLITILKTSNNKLQYRGVYVLQSELEDNE